MSTQARMPLSGLNHRELEIDEPDAFGGIALRRMPGLAVPFALVAAAAAFFAVFALGSFEPMREASPVWPAIVAVVPGAIAGAIIRRWRALYETFMNRPSRIARIALVVVVAGASIGGVVGICSWGDAGLAPCTVGGAIYALAFIPAALFVQGASTRAARARMGSLVADVDRRSVIVSLLAVVAFAALTQAPALASSQLSFLVNRFVQPALSVAVSVACAVGIHRIRRRDQDARAHLEEVAREAAWLERTVAVDDVEPGVTVDLGLGADRWSRTTELATYRTAPRSELVFCGSLHDARRAIDVALVQSRRALVFAVATAVVTIAAFVFGAAPQ
jgi:hypothetical protein